MNNEGIIRRVAIMVTALIMLARNIMLKKSGKIQVRTLKTPIQEKKILDSMVKQRPFLLRGKQNLITLLSVNKYTMTEDEYLQD